MTASAAASLRVVFFGTPAFAASSLDALMRSRHTVVGVVTQPDRPRGRGQRVSASPVKALAEGAGLPVLQPTRLKDPALLDDIRARSCDIGVVAAYGRLLPDALLEIPRLGMINVHASLLPKYRGASPIHHAVLAGDTESGITIMRVVTELDAGAALDDVRVAIGPDETTGALEVRLAEAGAALLVATLDRLAQGAVTETPQVDADATFAPRLEKARGQIDWTQPAHVVHNLVRGLQPWPGAWTYVAGQRLAIRRTSVGARAPDEAPLPPGTLVVTPGDPQVVCGDGGLVHLVVVQPEARRAMSGREFLAGHPVPGGTQLGPGPA